MTNFEELLSRTSKTFGLAIPLLEEPLRYHLTLAYLLFRTADTIEDADGCPPEHRSAALAELGVLFNNRDQCYAESLAEKWASWKPHFTSDQIELLAKLPSLMHAVDLIPENPREIIFQHLVRTVEGMGEFVRRTDTNGHLQLETIYELRRYCYAVAGIVGELITELALERFVDLNAVAEPLRKRDSVFGEALQLVNILKDNRTDVLHGRNYLPRNIPREQIVAIAKEDLSVADTYVRILETMDIGHGLYCFTRLPLLLAQSTLRRIIEQDSHVATYAEHAASSIIEK